MALEKEQGLLCHQPLHGRKPWAGPGAGVAGLMEAGSKNTRARHRHGRVAAAP